MKHPHQHIFDTIVDNDRLHKRMTELALEMMKVVCEAGNHKYDGDKTPEQLGHDGWMTCEECIVIAAIETAVRLMPDDE